jgi:hypothetical protein
MFIAPVVRLSNILRDFSSCDCGRLLESHAKAAYKLHRSIVNPGRAMASLVTYAYKPQSGLSPA